MSKKVFYRYNENTSNYERVYLSAKQKLWVVIRHFIIGVLIGIALFLTVYYWFDFPREKQLKQQNKELKSQYDILQVRLDRSLGVMEDLQMRDDNFYRVMMQADRINPAMRYAGLDNEARYAELKSLNDAELITNVTRKTDQLDRELYTQIKSYNELISIAKGQKNRIDHIPSIQPIADKDLKRMASGYGRRIDPIYGTSKFHEGLDFASEIGTPIFATGNGTVTEADWNSGYGNLIILDHGYNYTTRYAHLSKILVRPGQTIKRGDKIGEVGNTGKSTGPHLHYEVRFKGEAQNPIDYYFFDITPQQYNELIKMAENAGHVMD
ncbi:MAG: M23 family metallopeptidase [Muribaculaceae bacterium]